MKHEILIKLLPESTLYGVWGASNDKTVAKDIEELSRLYHELSHTREGGVLPFYVLSRDYDPAKGTASLFIGGNAKSAGLEGLTLPGGEYAVMEVRPALGFLWEQAVGEAKRYFYTRWLPASCEYSALNMEYELHTQKTTGKHPSLDLIFAVKRK